MKESLRPILGLIPARAVSKGVPRKNLQRLAGRTLVALAVDCSLQTGLFDRIVVSTDGEAIAREAEAAGAEIIWRPEELASDTATVVEAIAHTLAFLANEGFLPKTVALLEPSCPLRRPSMIEDALKALNDVEAAFTVSRVPTQYHAVKQFVLESNSSASPACPGATAPPRRQDLTPTFIRNGAVYAFRTSMFYHHRSVTGPSPRAIVVEEPLINIDTLNDLQIAQRMFSSSSFDPNRKC